jgi:superfamily II DNA or RNA helicase
VNTLARNDLAARSWLQHGQSRQTLIFAVDIQHAKDLATAFKRRGLAAEAIWGDDPERAGKAKAHRGGKLKVLVNVGLYTEGYDDPRIG